jgi:uncharacterized protein with gpF-like domain
MAKSLDFKQGNYKEAVDFFRQKINLPTKKWNELQGAFHTRAFTVAGAMREDIISDFREAIDKAVASGSTLQDFKKDFNKIAGKWVNTDKEFEAKMTKPGYNAWRSKVIYSTNVNTAYAAARERQVRDPELIDVFSHAKYVCMMLPTSRDSHKAWNGTVLPVTDPWWDKHSPPNGFGCLCRKEFISKYEISGGLEKVSSKAPTKPDDTTNIGENWDYSIGEADKGVYWASERKEVQNKLKEMSSGWEEVSQRGLWSSTEDTTDSLTVITDKKFAPDNTINEKNLKERLEKALGIKEGEIATIPFEDKFTKHLYNMRMDVFFFTNHIKSKNREKYLPMIIQTLKTPAQIRVQFLKSLKTRKTAIRTMFWNKFEYNKQTYLIQVIGDSACINEFAVWTAYNSKQKQKIMTGVPIFESH